MGIWLISHRMTKYEYYMKIKKLKMRNVALASNELDAEVLKILKLKL